MKIMRNGVLCDMTPEEELLNEPTPTDRIEELKTLLARTDYKTLKFVEGRLAREEFEEAAAQRELWRAEINLLEGGEQL